MSGHQTRFDPQTGRVMKSGLNLNPPGHKPDFQPTGCMYRAVVVRTYSTVDPIRREGVPGTSRVQDIECDIVFTRSNQWRPRVPVLQRVHGVNDADLWVPRESTRVIGGVQKLNLRRVSERGALESMPPSWEDLDGDHVLVQFLEDDPELPRIVLADTHASTKRLLIDGPGWNPAFSGAERGIPMKDERYSRFRGVEHRINDSGDVLWDTVGANPIDNDTEIPGLTGGAFRLRVKGNQRYTLEFDGVDVMEVFIDPLAGPQAQMVPGSEQFIRGTTHAGNLSAFLAATQTFTDVAAKACSAGALVSVGPLAAFKPAWVALGNAFAIWGGMNPPSADPAVIPIPPALAPVGVFSATLVDGVALSTKIRGD